MGWQPDESLAGLEKREVLLTSNEIDGVTAHRAAITEPALILGIDVEIGAAAIGMKGTATDQRPAGRSELNAVPSEDVRQWMVPPQSFNVVASTRVVRHYRTSLLPSPCRRRSP
jgi:hypothetical protein